MKNHMRIRLVSAVLAALAVAGCSGSNGNSTASQLTYVNPTSADAGAWQLVKDSSSTGTELVLALVGPPGVKTRGVGFNLQGDSNVHFMAFDGGVPAEDTGVYQLNSAVRDPTLPLDITEPTFMAAGVKPGNLLTVGIFQKDRTVPAADSSVPVVRIKLGLAAGAKPGSLGLKVVKAKVLPDDIGGTTNGVSILEKSHLIPAEVSVGTLEAK
jgi:hypothetical protein